MKKTVKMMDARLEIWGAKIENLGQPSRRPAVAAGAGAPLDIKALRALHAAAVAEFSTFRVANTAERARLKPQTVMAWNKLAAAVRNLTPAT